MGNMNYNDCIKRLEYSKIIEGRGYVPTSPFEIKKVIFKYPATIVNWADGTKTVVKCAIDEDFDVEKGLAMAISKKALGNCGHYYETFKKYISENTLK